MGDLVGYDDWLQAQNCLLGAALIDPELVPRVVTELTPEDFSGNGLLVYKAMADLFHQAKCNRDVDMKTSRRRWKVPPIPAVITEL